MKYSKTYEKFKTQASQKFVLKWEAIARLFIRLGSFEKNYIDFFQLAYFKFKVAYFHILPNRVLWSVCVHDAHAVVSHSHTSHMSSAESVQCQNLNCQVRIWNETQGASIWITSELGLCRKVRETATVHPVSVYKGQYIVWPKILCSLLSHVPSPSSFSKFLPLLRRTRASKRRQTPRKSPTAIHI